MPSHLIDRRQQNGQAMVFVVLFLGVTILSLVFLYKAGKITSEKMQLQNAADAAAYSVSITEARDLNFMAYTNRAMVANEVAIGQLVGMASWATHWASFEAYLMAYERLFVYPLVQAVSLGTAGDAVENVFVIGTYAAFNVPGNLFYNVFKAIANVGATVLHNINKAYSAGQTGYHYASILYSLSAYIDLVEDNAPDAKISDFGILSIIAHTLSYVDIIPELDAFVKTYKPTDAEHAEGFKRLASVIHASRDEFSRKRGWNLEFEIPGVLPININLPRDDLSLKIGPFEVWMELIFRLSFELEKTGASELRFIGDVAQGDQFNWSGTDVTSLLFDLYFKIAAGLDAFGETLAGGSFETALSGGTAQGKLVLTALGTDITILDIPPPTITFPTSMPFSSGAVQLGRTRIRDGDLRGIDSDSYGGSPRHAQAWGMDPRGLNAAPFVGWGGPDWNHLLYQVPTVRAMMPKPARRLNRTYRGLPQYSDTSPKDNPWGFEAPYFLAGVVKDAEDIYSDTAPLTNDDCIDNTDTDSMDVDNIFHLNDACIADRELGVISKSEVYFKRPTDLTYFTRADGLEEYGSAFNPYWQARLVETTYADRMFALAIQQFQTFGVIDGIQDIIASLSTLPTDITTLFP